MPFCPPTYLHVMFVLKLIFQEFQDTTFLTGIVIIYLLFFLSQVKDSVWKSLKMSRLDYISKKSFPSRKSVFIAVKAVQKQSIFVTFLAFLAVNIAPAFPSRKLRCEGSKFRSTFGAWMRGIFHGIHEAWDDATRDASETKNIINESTFFKTWILFIFHTLQNSSHVEIFHVSRNLEFSVFFRFFSDL